MVGRHRIKIWAATIAAAAAAVVFAAGTPAQAATYGKCESAGSLSQGLCLYWSGDWPSGQVWAFGGGYYKVRVEVSENTEWGPYHSVATSAAYSKTTGKTTVGKFGYYIACEEILPNTKWYCWPDSVAEYLGD